MDRPTPASTLWPAGVALLGEEAAEGVLHRWIVQEREALAAQRVRWMYTFERALARTHGRASHDARGSAGVLHAMVQLDGAASLPMERIRRQVVRLTDAAEANDAEVARAWAWPTGVPVDRPSEQGRGVAGPHGPAPQQPVQVVVEEGDAFGATPPRMANPWPAVASCAMPWSEARFRVTLVCADLEGARRALAQLPRAVSPAHGAWAAWSVARVLPGLRVAGWLCREPAVPEVVWAWVSAAAEAAGEAFVEMDDGRLAWCVPASVPEAYPRGAEGRPAWCPESLPVAGGRLRFRS